MYLKIIQTDTEYEVYRYENPPLQSKRKGAKRIAKKGLYYTPRRTLANTRRARKNFVRLVRANLRADECPAFLTLTMRDFVSVGVSYSCLKGFFISLRSIVGKDIKYIAVPEFQKRGAVHFHILVWGLPQEIIKYERRTRLIQNCWSLGYVDIITTDGSEKLAGYLGKYMSKSMLHSDIGTSKAYSCSRNVLRPVSFTSHTMVALPESFWSEGNIILTEREFEVPFMGACHYQKIVKRK